MVDESGKEIGTFNTVIREYNDNFQYQFIEESSLTPEEQKIWAFKDFIFSLYGDEQYQSKIRISTNINEMLTGDTLGVYDSSIDEIIIKRDVLKDASKFCEILFHELVHATTGYPDNDRRFENELGMIVGKLSTKLIEKNTQAETSESPKKKKFLGFLPF